MVLSNEIDNNDQIEGVSDDLRESYVNKIIDDESEDDDETERGL